MKCQFIDVSDILAEIGLEKRVKATLDRTVLENYDKELKLTQPIDIDLAISNIGRRLLAKGSIKGQVWLECSRCLTAYCADFDIEIEESFCLKDQCEGEEDVREIIGDKINLCPIVSQNVHLWIPMKNLCHDECKGLCPKCGKNWNKEKCNCSQDEIDPRLLVLKDYFSKENKT